VPKPGSAAVAGSFRAGLINVPGADGLNRLTVYNASADRTNSGLPKKCDIGPQENTVIDPKRGCGLGELIHNNDKIKMLGFAE